jgi:murein hydrolase activator
LKRQLFCLLFFSCKVLAVQSNFSQILSEYDKLVFEVKEHEQVLRNRLRTADEQSKKLGLFLADALLKKQIVEEQIHHQLQSNFMTAKKGVLPLLLGAETLDGFVFRSYALKQISKRNRALFEQYSNLTRQYEQKKAEAEAVKARLTRLNGQLLDKKRILAKTKVERKEAFQKVSQHLALSKSEVLLLQKKHYDLEALIKSLPRRPIAKKEIPSILAIKGYLQPPSSGSFFFSYRASGMAGLSSPKEGVTFFTARPKTVSSVFEGRVVFTGYMKHFGRTVIVDHGNAVHSVYANLNNINVNFGEYIPRGSEIGVMGQAKESPKAQVYFEIRQNGLARDPSKWLKIGAF